MYDKFHHHAFLASCLPLRDLSYPSPWLAGVQSLFLLRGLGRRAVGAEGSADGGGRAVSGATVLGVLGAAAAAVAVVVARSRRP